MSIELKWVLSIIIKLIVSLTPSVTVMVEREKHIKVVSLLGCWLTIIPYSTLATTIVAVAKEKGHCCNCNYSLSVGIIVLYCQYHSDLLVAIVVSETVAIVQPISVLYNILNLMAGYFQDKYLKKKRDFPLSRKIWWNTTHLELVGNF